MSNEFGGKTGRLSVVMRKRTFTRWCVALTTLWVFLSWPATSGIGGFWRHAGFPFVFAWGTFGRFEDFDIFLLLADFLLGVVAVIGLSWLCAWSRSKADDPNSGHEVGSA